MFGSNFQWNFNSKSYIFIHENAFENIVSKVAAILFQPQCVKYAGKTQTAIATITGSEQISVVYLVSGYNNSGTYGVVRLTHWGRVTHICFSKLTIIDSYNALSPGRHQAIIWTNPGMLLSRTLGTNLSEILSEMHTFLFKKMYLKMWSAKWRPFRLFLNVLTQGRPGPLFTKLCDVYHQILLNTDAAR